MSHEVITGNLAEPPTYGVSGTGKKWCHITILSTDRYQIEGSDKWHDGPTVRTRVSTFNNLAENLANSLTTGDPVVASGDVRTTWYTGNDGERRPSRAMTSNVVGLVPRNGTVTYARNPRQDDQPEYTDTTNDVEPPY